MIICINTGVLKLIRSLPFISAGVMPHIPFESNKRREAKMKQNELQKQINWLEEQVAILTPSGSEAYEVPESILKTLKDLRSSSGTSSGSHPEPLFSDEEYRILLAALGRERKICEKADGEGSQAVQYHEQH